MVLEADDVKARVSCKGLQQVDDAVNTFWRGLPKI